jgi:hypothetical protein
MRTRNLFMACVVLLGCGGGQAETLPDETDDLGLETAGGRSGGPRVGPEVGGTQWRWVEAHCTEGPLDLGSRGFEQQLRIAADDHGLLLTYDQVFAAEQCAHTVVQRAAPLPRSNEFQITEEVRVAQPATDACAGRIEAPRRGEVRMNGQFLEVLVQRSFVWCNGLEVRHVYLPGSPTALTNEQIARHYVAHFNRRDANAIAGLFAESGSLVEPFQVTHTGGATRHDGRAAVRAWYADTFAGVEWLALKLDQVQASEQSLVVDWSYMDPRLEDPFQGRNHFTIAAGEIFESRIEVTEPPTERSEEADADSEAVGEGA